MQGCRNNMSDWSHFIRDKLKISIYLSRDKFKQSLIQFCIIFLVNYYELTMPCCMENSVDPDQLASESGSTLFSIEVSYTF